MLNRLSKKTRLALRNMFVDCFIYVHVVGKETDKSPRSLWFILDFQSRTILLRDSSDEKLDYVIRIWIS